MLPRQRAYPLGQLEKGATGELLVSQLDHGRAAGQRGTSDVDVIPAQSCHLLGDDAEIVLHVSAEPLEHWEISEMQLQRGRLLPVSSIMTDARHCQGQVACAVANANEA